MPSKYGDRSILSVLANFVNFYLQCNYRACLECLDSLKAMIEDIEKLFYEEKR